ncbi:MAG: hypothetical protein U0270_30955 [Labilithrix sp.]
MNRSLLSRRSLLKGAFAIGGAAAGSRIAGPFVGNALAATEPSHFVHIFFNAGLNALFSGCADKYVAGNVFDVTSSNIKEVGNGVVTDAATWGTFPQIALDHWAAVGMKHGVASHTVPNNINGGGERAILLDGGDSALTKLAHAMGGDSAFKAVHFGDRMPAYKQQPAFQGVSIDRITSLSDALKSIGAGGSTPASTTRADSQAGLEASLALGNAPIAMNPKRLGPLGEAYKAAIAALKKPERAASPVTAADIDKAYGLGGATTVSSFASMLAGAEIMIRGAGTNVVNITDLGFASWDFHQVSGGKSQNGFYSRRKFLGEGAFKENRVALLKTFLDRMLNMEGRNVVVALSGEMVRLPNGDHGDGTVAALFGKRVKQGVSFGVDARSRFAPSTPSPKGFWAACAAACGVEGQPFGANPHAVIA